MSRSRSVFLVVLLLVVSLALLPGRLGATDEVHWSPLGPGGGGNSFVWGISPLDPNIVLAAGDVGGMYRSSDGGVTWLTKNQVALRPNQRSAYSYGRGHFTFNPPSGNQNVVYLGLQKSTDAGNTWSVNVDDNDTSTWASTVDPVDPNIVYAWGYGNYYRSTDAFSGTSCTGSNAGGMKCEAGGKACRKGMKCYQRGCLPNTSSASAAGCTNYNMYTAGLVVNPTGAGSTSTSQLLACTNVGFFKSTDSGTTWNRFPNTASGLPTGMPGLCTGGTKQGKACATSSDCGGGTCVASICGGSNNVCSTDTDCRPNLGDTQTCQNGRCGGSGTQCWIGSDCSQGQVCNALSCNSITIGNDASHTLYVVLGTRPALKQSATGGSGQDPWVDIEQWRGGVYKSTDFGSSWTETNGIGDGLDTLSSKNPSFESALGDPLQGFAWVIPSTDTSYVSRVCSVDPAHTGTCSIKITYPQSLCVGGSNNGNACSSDLNCPSGYCNFTHQVNTPDPADGSIPAGSLLQVTGGSLYKLRAWYKVTSGTVYPSYTKVHWYKSDRTPLLYPGKPWYSLEPWVQNFPVGSPRTYDWQKFETLVRAPDQAAYVRVDFRAGVGTIWIDDVSFQATQDLPRITGRGEGPWFASYSDVAVPAGDTSGNYIYVTTYPSTTAGQEGTDTTGVWRTSDKGDHWSLMTRAAWHDNVIDNSRWEPSGGDGVCGGRWETCYTSPGDCNRNYCSGGSNDGFLCASGSDCPSGSCVVPSFCCGDATCSTALGESRKNCPVDCYDTGDHDPVRVGQNENCTSLYGGYGWNASHCNTSAVSTWSLALGLPSGGSIPGQVVVYTGNQHLKSADGGLTWQDMTSVAYTSPPGEEPGAGTYQGRGSNDVFTFFVAKDSRTSPARLYNGDTDNSLMVSYNNGTSFTSEGWQWGGYYRSPQDPASPLLNGDAATSIVLTSDVNQIFVGVANGAGSIQYSTNYGPSAVVRGIYTPKSGNVAGYWTWTRMGQFLDGLSQPILGGGIDLVRNSGGDLLAAYYSHGVFKLLSGQQNPSGVWSNTYTGSNWNPVPVNWKTYRLKLEPTTGRLYMGAGDPQYLNGYSIPAGETGVWESNDSGANWCRISPAGTGLDNDMDKEAVIDLVPLGSDSLVVATTIPLSGTADTAGNYTGDGGLYKGMRIGNCNWSWTRVMKQPRMSGLAVSPTDRSTLYAFAGQGPSGGSPTYITGQKAGIYRSNDEGVTWYTVINDGLGNLNSGYLNLSDTDPNVLYASTIGSGSFVGARSCTNPATEASGPFGANCFDGLDNDCDGVVDFDADAGGNCSINATTQTIVAGSGVIVSGSVSNLVGKPDQDTTEVIKEKSLGSTKPLDFVWTFTPIPTDRVYYLHVEGFKASDANDTFTFKSTTKTSGTCDGSESGYTTRLTLSNTITYDTDKDTIASLGTVTNGSPVVCIRLVDGGVSDSHQDTVTLDRVFVFPEPPDIPVTSEQTVIGSITAGSYVSTLSSDNVRESLREAADSTDVGQSRLEHIWRVDNVPVGSSHSLGLEGNRPSGTDSDNFQFQYSTDGINFSDIAGALISTPMEAPFGYFPFGPAGIGGTIYIRVKDTNTTSGTPLDTVNIDKLSIKTTP